MNQESSVNTRRSFIQKIAGTVIASSIPGLINATENDEQVTLLRKYYKPNDNIQIALIGAGGMGTADAKTNL